MKRGVYEAVMERDKVCVLSFLEPGHLCRTRFGTPHEPHEFLTFEHVKQHLATGIKKVDDARWGVALCGYANNRPPTKVQRALIREYLASLYPAHVHKWESWDPENPSETWRSCACGALQVVPT